MKWVSQLLYRSTVELFVLRLACFLLIAALVFLILPRVGLAQTSEDSIEEELQNLEPSRDIEESLEETENLVNIQNEGTVAENFDLGPRLPKDFMHPFLYKPNGRRDPFVPYVKIEVQNDVNEQNPLERFNLGQLKLEGIMWDVAKPKAMILDPSGNVHVVGLNSKIGRNNGYIAVIREGELVVVEEFITDEKVSFVTRVMQINP